MEISPADGSSKSKGHYPGGGSHQRLSHVFLVACIHNVCRTSGAHTYCIFGPDYDLSKLDIYFRLYAIMKISLRPKMSQTISPDQ
jgi:hypothetical protein